MSESPNKAGKNNCFVCFLIKMHLIWSRFKSEQSTCSVDSLKKKIEEDSYWNPNMKSQHYLISSMMKDYVRENAEI